MKKNKTKKKQRSQVLKIEKLNSTSHPKGERKNKISLKEDSEPFKNLIIEWREKSQKMSLKKLPKFLNSIINDYHHDYGTVCHAFSIGAVATMWALNNEKGSHGGITGFQASAIMWETIMNWQTQYRGKPLKLVDYSNMLYPQYGYKFEKTLSPNNWRYIQDEANRVLNEMVSGRGHPAVIDHMKSIVDGVVPFGYTVSTEN